MNEEAILAHAENLYPISSCELTRVSEHEGGRNVIFIVTAPHGEKRVLRISTLPDRSLHDYLAETEFMHHLAQNGAHVADVIPSLRQFLVERIEIDGQSVYLSMFEYAPGGLLSDYGYRYRDGAPLREYFYNTGKTLGVIHRLSKQYRPVHRRQDYTDKYRKEYIDQLIPDAYMALKEAIFRRFTTFQVLPKDTDSYGLVHFDFSDGRYA